VTSDAHNAAARQLASSAMVLLKNEGVLPLSQGLKNVAVIGGLARDPIIAGGGSGQVFPPYKSAPLDAISSKVGSANVRFDDGLSASIAAQVAAAADVAIVVVGTKSGEGRDRKNLHLINGWNAEGGANYDDLISNVTSACSKTGTKVIVVMTHTGAVLTPWRASVQGIIAAFMPGQEYGNALVDVLWGDVSPTGRLPLTFPARDNQVGFTEAQWPGLDLDKIGHSTYSEKLEVGYRYYDAHNEEPAFPFGHGLSYTQFEYSGLQASRSSVSFTLRNAGDRDGAEVVQLYLGFPQHAGEPPKQLKGFKSVQLAAGASTTVQLPLIDRSVSTWSIEKHNWEVQQGSFSVMVGASSRDIRLNGSFSVGGASTYFV
jgi:beta-glucosidase